MSSFIERLGWVLVHSLWQFALLAIVAFVFQRALRRTSASVRYVVLLAQLGLVVAGPLVTWSQLPAPPQLMAIRSDPVPEPAVRPAPAAQHAVPEALVSPSAVTVSPPVAIASTAPAFVTTAPLPELPKPAWSERVQGTVTPWLSAIVWGWSLGVLLFAIRPLWSWLTIRRLRTTGISPVPESVQAALAQTARRLGVSPVVRIWQSTIVQVPIVAGYFKPVILLPVSIVTGLSPSQLEAILAHELAHIRRHDYLVNLAQTLVETVFFYHPAVWWLSHQIRCERENCCDDIAVSVIGNRLDYSRALLALEELRAAPTPLALGANGGSLVSRVRRLFGREPTPESLTNGSLALGATLVAGVLSIAALAGTEGVEPKQDPTSLSGPLATLQSWPQLGGSSSRNTVSPVTNLPIQFDLAKNENIRWKSDIGSFTFSSPVVSGGKVLIGSNNSSGAPAFPQLELVCLLGFDVARWHCFDEQTGQLLWQYTSERIGKAAMLESQDWPGLGLAGTPCIEGDRVWLATNRNEIVCLDLNGFQDGEDNGLPEPEASAPGATRLRADIIWKFDMRGTLGTPPMNATCGSPTIAGDLVLVNTSNDVDEIHQKVAAPRAPSFFALSKVTGELVWSSNAPGENILAGSCHGVSPAVGKIGDTWQAVFAGLDGWIYSFDLVAIREGRTELLWTFDVNLKESVWERSGKGKRNLPTTPVIWNNKVLVATGRNPEHENRDGHLWCIDAMKRGDLSMELVYNKSAPDVVIPHKRVQACEPDKGDFTRTNPNQGIVWNYQGIGTELDGRIPFEHVLHRTISLPVVHDGLVVVCDMSGIVHCLDAVTGKGYWTHDLFANSWSTPLITDGKIWVTSDDSDVAIFALSKQKQLLAEPDIGQSSYSTLAAANQTLYVATTKELLAVVSGAFPQPDAVVAQLPGGLEIELVGITKNAASPIEGWQLDGSPLGEVGDWPRGTSLSVNDGRFTIATGELPAGMTPSSLARDLLFECRGLRSQPSWVVLGVPGMDQFQTLTTEEAYRQRLSYLPQESGQDLKFEMALTDSPWGPWQSIGKTGQRVGTVAIDEADRSFYDDLKVVRFGLVAGGSPEGSAMELVLDEPATHEDYSSGVFDMSVRLIGTDGKARPTYAMLESSKPGRRVLSWRTALSVSPDKIDHAEFRLRPYRHFVTFENVPLDRQPGRRVVVKHRSITEPVRPPSDPRFLAKVPGGIEIELLRIVRNDLPAEKNWLPDGSPAPGRVEWPERSGFQVTPGGGYSSSHERPGSDRVWDFLYDVRSPEVQPYVSVVPTEGYASSSQTIPVIGPRLITLLPDHPKELSSFRMRIGTEPWGEWVQVDPSGEIVNAEALREQLQTPQYRFVELVEAGMVESDLDRSFISWRLAHPPEEFVQIEQRAITDDGRTIRSNHSSHGMGRNQTCDITESFDIPLSEVNRFEYRVRPYQHLVTFENVSLDPEQKTEVKVRVEPIAFDVVENIPEPPLKKFIAQVPGGIEVELLGTIRIDRKSVV